MGTDGCKILMKVSIFLLIQSQIEPLNFTTDQIRQTSNTLTFGSSFSSFQLRLSFELDLKRVKADLIFFFFFNSITLLRRTKFTKYVCLANRGANCTDSNSSKIRLRPIQSTSSSIIGIEKYIYGLKGVQYSKVQNIHQIFLLIQTLVALKDSIRRC